MKKNLESIKNSIFCFLRNEKIILVCKKLRTFSVYSYDKIYDSVTFCAKWLHQKGVSANFITLFGFAAGLLAVNFLSMEMYGTALLCILINRWFDALDGAVAKLAAPTKFGVFLDAALDYIFYGGVIFGFALANPMQNAVAASFLLFAFSASACSLLAYAVVAYKNKKDMEALSDSPFYLGGAAQGAETFFALVILCLVPSLFLQIAVVLGVLCLIKAISIISGAYYNFVIAEKNNEKKYE